MEADRGRTGLQDRGDRRREVSSSVACRGRLSKRESHVWTDLGVIDKSWDSIVEGNDPTEIGNQSLGVQTLTSFSKLILILPTSLSSFQPHRTSKTLCQHRSRRFVTTQHFYAMLDSLYQPTLSLILEP